MSLASAVVATAAGALVDGVRTPPATAVAAPAPRTASADDADPSLEASPGSGAPLSDLLLPPSADGLPHDTLDIRDRSSPSLRVPILMYHYIRVNPVAGDTLGASLSVTPAHFAAQMAMLRRAGVHTVSLGDLMTALSGGRPLPPRSVVLTFDDGYADFATAALPVLRAEGFTATVFVVSGFVGRRGYLTAAQITEAARAEMTIGAHTIHHVALTQLPTGLARTEIQVSRQILEQLSGQPVDDFAYPYGDTSRGVEALVAGAGFRDAVGTGSGSTEVPARQFSLDRVRVDGRATLATVAGEVLGPLGVLDAAALAAGGGHPATGPAPGMPW